MTDHEVLGSAFEAAFQAVPNGVVILDGGQRIAWMNTHACVHLALEPEGDLGQPITNLIRDPALVAALNDPQAPEDFRIGSHRADQVLLLQVRTYAPGRRMVLSHAVTEADRMETMRRGSVAPADRADGKPGVGSSALGYAGGQSEAGYRKLDSLTAVAAGIGG